MPSTEISLTEKEVVELREAYVLDCLRRIKPFADKLTEWEQEFILSSCENERTSKFSVKEMRVLRRIMRRMARRTKGAI